MIVDFSQYDGFLPLFYKLQDAKKRFVVNYGGSGSGKSYSQHQLELINILDTNHDTLLVRKYASTIRNSSYQLLINIAKEFGIYDLFKWNYSGDNRQIINKATGKRILFTGLDDKEKIKSLAGIKRIVAEEASELAFEDFRELVRRARGIDGIQYFLLLNPINEHHWINTNMVQPTGAYYEDTEIFHTTYKDNKFLTEEDVKEFDRLKLVSENEYNIYALGQWGIDNRQNKFAWAFSESLHTGYPVYNPNNLLWLSFDFNVNPVTCGVIQKEYMDDGVHINVIESIQLVDSNIYELCNVIKSKYGGAAIYVTGDATGKNRSALAKSDMNNYYQVIASELNLGFGQFKVPSVNPNIEHNQVVLNSCLLKYKVTIHKDNAKHLIYDLKYVEVDEDKKIIKDRTSDKRLADHLDWFRYYLNIDCIDVLKV